jgi:uncharacterized protein (UPF0335 family)
MWRWNTTGNKAMATKLNSGNFSTDQLNQLVARIERLEEEKKALADDIREVYAEAKAHGFDTKILRQVIKLRKLDRAELAEQESLLEIYMNALGMLAETPLGQAAIKAAQDGAGAPAPSDAQDEFYDRAVDIVRKHGKASASLVQRHLEIGYNRAARILDAMAEQGVIGPPDAYGKRPVLEAVHG